MNKIMKKARNIISFNPMILGMFATTYAMLTMIFLVVLITNDRLDPETISQKLIPIICSLAVFSIVLWIMDIVFSIRNLRKIRQWLDEE